MTNRDRRVRETIGNKIKNDEGFRRRLHDPFYDFDDLEGLEIESRFMASLAKKGDHN
jgi:hypothetical protein